MSTWNKRIRSRGNMPLVVPDKAEILLLEYIVNINRDNTEHPVLHLYSNNIDPEDGSHGVSGEDFSTGTFTEASAAGYSAITLTGAGWTTTQVTGITTAEYNVVTFTFTTGENIYGYYVTDTNDSIIWAERFPGAPYSIPGGGGDIGIGPQITLS
jgi:hypothetical protein